MNVCVCVWTKVLFVLWVVKEVNSYTGLAVNIYVNTISNVNVDFTANILERSWGRIYVVNTQVFFLIHNNHKTLVLFFLLFLVPENMKRKFRIIYKIEFSFSGRYIFQLKN